MIPIVSITDLVLAVLCFGISAKLFASYKTKPSQLMRYFLAFYLFFGISFLFFSIPEIFSKHATIITVFNILAYLSFYLALAYIAQVPFDLLGKTRLAMGIFYFAAIFGIIFVIMRFVDYHPSVPEIKGSYIFWKPIYASWLRSATGIFSGALAIITTIIFYTQGIKHRANRLVFIRSMWMGTGLLFLLFSSLSTYTLNPAALFTPILVSTILAMIGLILIFIGVLYKTEETIEPSSTLN
ncbi:hypothetical protein A3H10_03065 [Candidatus Uhrbacteria bacterium RIFCSPLOWO2_12_FULL_46_10]|uniref:Histidine kinase N-terminal 7TM region domain-containing protein n=1 Tax=Candidatus Uhrbacteria bacterium RIFCSPLOWO2_01_FULL_47_25 TaxID=1802402 RepID=A0A1F7UXQ1_9BACT|nr:MAG: hypothetical protein UX68_C0022G0008 [Parcubacteria group bacterium GW2011_GWA2_46_9]OGL59742.1 MAG: hypothetical protein A2752_03070 [Candidatus Uhrbacteria bacterium RIFCSPHIGHO2_01_FULL_46_23]OGL70538.1 MAG: hypothetical protein A3D60_03640 [Candidatus Uhrbacteria bacterium RIFCSPHIGHO2_02_FULL_47_29]OGL75127.1 MAG: hypothetical protein A3E96_04270 [Candidatus Uhrbacteria bacterium RIFCSPHIGHO2_12_FULL_46_13]OGL83071.1 MAG: hypothetical protein A2936_05145 [Candidatus Uhrbacteria bac